MQTPAAGQVPPTPNFAVHRAAGPIVVDGRLDDAGWAGTADIPIKWEITPGDNTPALAQSTCHVTFDSSKLYVGCHAFDPRPEQIRAHLVDRDNVIAMDGDDLIAFYVDPFNDHRRAFFFAVNALGVQAEGVSANQSEDFSWDAVWSSAGRITNDGYEVEMAIPFTSFRFARTANIQTWGFVFVRAWPRNMRYRMEAGPYDRRNTCAICQSNQLTGFEGIGPGKNVEISPTFTAGRTDTRDSFPGGPLTHGEARARPGLDLRWGITPNVSLNATVRPDFSQVEADVAQLDVNKRFALFYPEKRPFFLEGADIFTTPIQAVFSRTVADPDAGLKMTGKLGGSTGNTIGVFAARDRLTNLLFPSNQGTGVTSLDQDAWTTVGRFRRDLGRVSNIGLLYTGRVGSGYQNQVGGADLGYQLDRSTRVSAQYLGSATAYPDSTAMANGQHRGTFSGGAALVDISHTTNRWQSNLSYTDVSPGFRADAGFVPRSDFRTLSLSVAKQFYRGTGWFNLLSLGPYASQTRDHGGTLTDQEVGFGLYYTGPAQSTLASQLIAHRERYQGTLYRLTRSTGYVNLKPTAGVALTGTWQIGGAVDYANARPASEITVSSAATLNIGRGLALEASDAFQRLRHQGATIFTANILQSKIAYNFSTRTMVRQILQYRNVDRNPLEYGAGVDRNEKGLTGQFLLAYKANPQTVIFLGYSGTAAGADRFGLTTASRTLFAKIGYGWRP